MRSHERRAHNQRRSQRRIVVHAIALVAAVRVAPAQPRLTAEPRQPAAGALIRLTIDRLVGNADSAVRIDGTMAGEPLRFRAASRGRLQAIAAIPVEVSDSAVAQVTVERQSGAVDTLRLMLPYPHRPPPAARRAVAFQSRRRESSQGRSEIHACVGFGDRSADRARERVGARRGASSAGYSSALDAVLSSTPAFASYQPVWEGARVQRPRVE